ncbi:MAG: hypothetical protein EOO57_19210 [Hymenobacter sp.]|nr:MAG: hypothetical protein EOO57_19210 [Hymenobacter sp.]
METSSQAQVFWAAQFETTAENGIIRLPADYPELANASLRVLVLSSEPSKAQAEAADRARRQARVERLRAAQAKLVAANPFRSIADPVQWQRDLRNEEERPLPGRP